MNTKGMTHAERKERRHNVARDYANGMSISDVCKKYDVSLATLKSACRECGIPWRSNAIRPRRVDSIGVLSDHSRSAMEIATARAEIIRDLLATGNESITTIALKLGLTRQRISQICKSFNIDPRDRPAKDQSAREYAVSLARNGMSVRDIASEVGRNKVTIREWLDREGVMAQDRLPRKAWRILAELLNTDDTLTDIAERLSTTTQTVWSVQDMATKSGIKVPKRKMGRPHTNQK
jgi:transposase